MAETDKNRTAATKRRTPVTRVQAAALALMLLVSTSAGYIGGMAGANNDAFTGRSQEIRQQVISESDLISDIAREVGQSVVSINVRSQGVARDFFGFGRTIEQESAGTGVIISEDGYVITNRHVVPEGTSDVSVVLSDGTELRDVEIVGRTGESDPLDIAFLKINDRQGKELKAATLGESSSRIPSPPA
jgi:serine protease Do